MFGVVSEMTPAGRTPVEGVSLSVLSCAVRNCPGPSIVIQETTTDKLGAYHLSGLYNGELNFLWLSKEGYVAGGPLPHVMAAKAVCFKEALAPAFSRNSTPVISGMR